MKIVDGLLNFASILIWIQWLAFFKTPTHIHLTLATLVKPADERLRKNYYPLYIILTIIILRAIFYYFTAPITKWNPTLNLIAISIPFKSDIFMRILLYSFLSFSLYLIVFYFWLFFLSIINHYEDHDLIHRNIIYHLGIFGRLPIVLKILTPFIACSILWLIFGNIFSAMGIFEKPPTFGKFLLQSGLLSLCLIFSLKYLIILICGFYIIYMYIYLGPHPFWIYMGLTGKRLLKFLKWLKIGRLELSPLVMPLIVAWLSLLAERWFPIFYQRSLL